MIKGESGMGKTLFVRCVIDTLKNEERKAADFPKYKAKENLQIICSSITASSEKLFLNGWIPIL